MAGSRERIPFLGQEPGGPHFEPVAAILASAVTIGPLAEMLLLVAMPPMDPFHRPSEVPAEEARGPVGRPVGTEPAPRSPTGRSAPSGQIQEDIGCAFPGLDNEQLRQAQQWDPDLAAVEATLREEKVTIQGPWSGAPSRWNEASDVMLSNSTEQPEDTPGT
ncbi:unnamed protein product [Lampetra fluviatilis]